MDSILRMTDTLNQHILLHPFIVLRRTCQVNRKCSPYLCIQPFSLIPFLYHQQRNQGIGALYKGLSSELLVKGITLGTETAIANYAEWPTNTGSKNYIKDSIKIITLRALSVALSTPFICSSLIATVQSVIVVRDRPSFVDCLRDGFLRIIHLRSTPSARMLPIWLLVVPTVFYHVSHSTIVHLAKHFVSIFRANFLCSPRLTRGNKSRHSTQVSRLSTMDDTKDSRQHDLTLNYDSTNTSIDTDGVEEDSSQISTSIIASFVADIALLPVETVMNSLFIQGTRTIIDNCDETTVVLPALTNYDGFNDCYQSIIKFEGTLGLYKGLGAILLQYSVHFLLFRSLYYILRECRSNSSGNAHQKSMTRVKRSMRTVADSEYMHNIENIRHSTPINPNAFKNQYVGKEFDVYSSPSDFAQL